MASSLADNFTILVSVANVIVIEEPRKRGNVIAFFEHWLACRAR
jgi:hypothetical protein